MNGAETTLTAFLAAWREDSLLPPLPAAREQAKAAMLGALVASRGRRHVWAFSLLAGYRPRFRHILLGAASFAVAGAVLVGVLGWNAPAGSPLYGVRAARQGIQLALPGANPATLHLQYAEAFLTDARSGKDRSASLVDARAELDAAHRDLPVNHGSPLWTRWSSDEAQLNVEEDQQDRDGSGAPGVAPGAPAAPGESESHSAGAAPTGSGEGDGHASPSPEPSNGPQREFFTSGYGDGGSQNPLPSAGSGDR